eukprot:TRINITY_DN805_c0_g1_i1.p1 TRINITY_DN805_c0_g1~~TRINITY_DN805_c0_g1_i1.p1  ORF type:complete len:486 (-),score=240.46 TRINITY_DN805_c0_g1_i1:62-1519(-)
MKKRVTVFACGSSGSGKVMFVPKKFADLLLRMTRKLSLPAPVRRVFNEHGGEIDAVELIQSNDVLYVSMGEDFRPRLISHGTHLRSVTPPPVVLRPRVMSSPPQCAVAPWSDDKSAVTSSPLHRVSCGGVAGSTSNGADADVESCTSEIEKSDASGATASCNGTASSASACQSAAKKSGDAQMPLPSPSPSPAVLHDSWLRLNVGGRVFVTTRSTLTQDGNNMLAHMFGSAWHSATDETGAYLIDRSPEYFAPLLNYLRCGKLHLDDTLNVNNVLEEARFFGLSGAAAQLEKLVRVADPDEPAFSRKTLASMLMNSTKGSELRARGLNFESADLSNLDLSGINFTRARFANANLENCVMDGCTMQEADLRGVRLAGASLRGAVLTGANLEGAQMKGVDLSVLDQRPANLESANLKNTDLEDAIMSGGSFRCCNFRGAHLANADLGRSDLAGANFEGADLKGANLGKCKMNGCNLRLATFNSRTGL